MSIGQQHAVLIEATDRAFELDATDEEDCNLTVVFSQPVECRVLAITKRKCLFKRREILIFRRHVVEPREI